MQKEKLSMIDSRHCVCMTNYVKKEYLVKYKYLDMKISILYICTGKYYIFFKDFYESCERYFIPEAEKTYFVFSDHRELESYEKVHLVYKECEGFPNDSLFRFRTFLTIEKELQKYDYIFFFNSNMQFVAPVDESVLPSVEDGYMCCLDADFNKIYPHPSFFPYERNRKSLAYIPRGLTQYRYYHAGLNGGRAKEYLEFCKTLNENIATDYQNGIVAIYHDESHVNKYFSEHSCLSLHEEYGTAEGSPNMKNAKIILVDKTKFSDYFNKGRSTSFWGKVKKMFWMVKHIISWYL